MHGKLLVSAAAGALLALTGTAFAQSAVVTTTDLNVRAGPGPGHQVLGVLGAGQSATLNGCLEGSKWCMVAFEGGDGWVYALNPANGEEIWKFDMNPKDSVWILGGRGTRNNIIATPVIYDNKVFLAVGQDPEHGEGPGHFYCIDATKTGDVTESGRIWHYGDDDFKRTLSSAAIADGLVYIADLSGFLHCLDAKTGKPYWVHDMLAAVWGSPMVIDDKVYLGDEDGDIVVLRHGKTMEVLGESNMGSSVYATPVPVNGVLFIMNRNQLYALQEGAGKK